MTDDELAKAQSDCSYAYNIYKRDRARVEAELIARFRLKVGMLVTNGRHVCRVTHLASSDNVPAKIDYIKGQRVRTTDGSDASTREQVLYDIDSWNEVDSEDDDTIG